MFWGFCIGLFSYKIPCTVPYRDTTTKYTGEVFGDQTLRLCEVGSVRLASRLPRLGFVGCGELVDTLDVHQRDPVRHETKTCIVDVPALRCRHVWAPDTESQVTRRSSRRSLVCAFVYGCCLQSQHHMHAITARSTPHNIATMASDDAKENIADGLISFKLPTQPPAQSPKKKKSRSKSIGPSGIGALEGRPSALKESNGNRRKVCTSIHAILQRYIDRAQSAFIPAVKSILVSNDIDEKKRREARRKSLGTIRAPWKCQQMY